MKPEFWTDEKLATASRDARLLLVALLNMSEDHGVARGNPAYVKSQAFPYDEDATAKKVSGWLAELERLGIIRRFGFDGQTYIHIVNFAEHQRIDRPSKTTHPTPPPETEDDARARRGLDEGSLLEGKGREGKGRERKGREAEPPDPLQVAWNELTTAPLSRCSEVTKDRKKRAEEALGRRPLEEWREVFARIQASSYCRGEKNGWVANFDWAIRKAGAKPETALSTLEGAFDDRRPKADARRGHIRAEDMKHSDEVGYVKL